VKVNLSNIKYNSKNYSNPSDNNYSTKVICFKNTFLKKVKEAPSVALVAYTLIFVQPK